STSSPKSSENNLRVRRAATHVPGDATEPRERATGGERGAGAPSAKSVHTVAHRERRRISSETPDGRFPHCRPRNVEHDVEIDVGHQPRGLREFFVELSWTPARVPGKHARTRRGPRFEHLTQERGRGRKVQPLADAFEFDLRLVAEQDPAALRVD